MKAQSRKQEIIPEGWKMVRALNHIQALGNIFWIIEIEWLSYSIKEGKWYWNKYCSKGVRI